MSERRYILAPEAARDLVAIWQYLRKEAGQSTADRIEKVIRSKFLHLAEFPASGHIRPDLTAANVKFFAVYSYLVVYRPDTKPLQIVSVLHGNRDVAELLDKRL